MRAETALNQNAKNLLSSPCHFIIVAAVEVVECSDKNTLLSDAEKKRADDFKSPLDSSCYRVAHSLKRHCLSELLKLEPQDLSFYRGKKGKPFCEQAQGLDFNLSHSGAWVLLGVSSRASIGVDIERSDRAISKKVIEYALNPEQILSLSEEQCEPANQVEKAIRYWTQKEAISKSMGGGISVGFKNIACSGNTGSHKAYCHEQAFLVQSQHMSGMVFSVASPSNTAVDIYELSQWNGESKAHLPLKKLF